MRTRLKGLLFVGILALIAPAVHAVPVFSENFDGYSTGDLVGQGNWAESNAGTPNIQVASGVVSLASSGQDAYKAFSSNVTHTDGSAIYTGADITVSAGHTGGDYFLNLGETLGGSFDERVYAKTTTGGFFLGLQDTSGTVVYGTTVLTLGTKYHIAEAWNFIAGATNDTMNLYVNPLNTTEGSNTVYVTDTWTSTEPTILKTGNLRQGSSTSAPTVVVDNFIVGTAFIDVVPEPASLAFVMLGGLVFYRRRRSI